MRPGSELQAVLLGGAAGGFAGPGDLDLVLDQDSTRAAGLTLGSGVVMVHDQHVDLVDQLKQIAAFFRDESCGQCVPCRVGTVRQEEAIERLAHSASEGDLSLLREVGQAMRDASICGLGQTAANAIDTRDRAARECSSDERVTLTIDGAEVTVPAGTTILAGVRRQGRGIPTLCYGDTITPKNACRVCMVEVEGSRVLVPSCSRKVEAGMVVTTRSERVDHARKMVLEFLGSSVDLSLTDHVDEWNAEYGADPARYGDRRRHRRPAGQGRQRPLRPRLRQVHPLLPVRRRLWRAVAEQLRDRDRRPRLRLARVDRARPAAARVGVRLLRQLHPGLPDRGADVQERVRHARRRHVGRVTPDPDRHRVRLLRRRVQPHAPRPGQHDRQGHVARPTRRSRTATCASRAGSAFSTRRTDQTDPTTQAGRAPLLLLWARPAGSAARRRGGTSRCAPARARSSPARPRRTGR